MKRDEDIGVKSQKANAIAWIAFKEFKYRAPLCRCIWNINNPWRAEKISLFRYILDVYIILAEAG